MPRCTLARVLALAFIGPCAVVLPSGCASKGAAAMMEATGVSQERVIRPARARITGFDIDGRLVVRQGEKRHIVHIGWQHDAGEERLLLTTPLGQGLAELTRDARGAHLRLSDQRTFEADDLEVLAQQVLGIRLPFSALSHWVTGDVVIPDDGQGQDDAAGRPQWRQINGWHIRYADYESPAANALPTLIEMQYVADDVDVRLKIDQWQISP